MNWYTAIAFPTLFIVLIGLIRVLARRSVTLLERDWKAHTDAVTHVVGDVQ